MGNILKTLIDIWHTHPAFQALTAIIVAGLWGFGGLQSIRKGKTSTGISWIIISVAILAIATVGFVVDRAWTGVVFSCSLTGTTGLVYGLDGNNSGFSGQFKGGSFYAPTPFGLGVGGSITHGGGVTVASVGVSAALAGRYGGGGSWTNTTQPLNVGNFTGFPLGDYLGYLLRRPCN